MSPLFGKFNNSKSFKKFLLGCNWFAVLCSFQVYSKHNLLRCSAKSCPTLCNPMDSSTPESFTVSGSLLRLMSLESVILSNHLILWRPLVLFNLSQHQGLFQWVGSLHQVTKVLELPREALNQVYTRKLVLFALTFLDQFIFQLNLKEKLHGLEYTILNCLLFWIYIYCFEFVTFEEWGK